MRRHLPLAGASLSAGSPGDARVERLPLSADAIGLADPDNGLLALEFAVELAAALRARAHPVALAVLDFAAPPSVPRRFAERLVALEVALCAHAIAAHAPALPALPQDARLLCVGLPALTAFAPRLSLVVTADMPLHRWPPALRTVRATLALELPQPRAGLAEALAAALDGVLPRRAPSVRL